jgi:hypothetical protein
MALKDILKFSLNKEIRKLEKSKIAIFKKKLLKVAILLGAESGYYFHMHPKSIHGIHNINITIVRRIVSWK